MPFVAPGSGSSTKSGQVTKGGFVAPSDDYIKGLKVNQTGGDTTLTNVNALKVTAQKKQQSDSGNAVGDVLGFLGGAARSTAEYVPRAIKGVTIDPIQSAVAGIKGNKKDIANAEKIKMEDNPFSPVATAADQLSSALVAPTVEKNANKTQADTTKTLNTVYGKTAAGKAYAEAQGSAAKQEILNRFLAANGIDQNTPGWQVAGNAALTQAGITAPLALAGLPETPGKITAGISKVRTLFGKAPDIPAGVATSTPINVVDRSTGTTKGVVSNVLPKSTGADVAPPTAVRPSVAGYTDAEFRIHFAPLAADVAKTNPAIVDSFIKTGSKDPLTLVTHALTEATTKGKVGKIVDKMVPGLQGADRTSLVESLAKNTDPQETAHLLYDAAHHQAASENAGALLTGTPMDKSISFKNPSDVENAQRQQLHVRIAQINKVLDNHGIGTKEQTPEALNALLKSRQTAQDVLDGKTDYNTAYRSNTQPIKPLPFVGEPTEAPSVAAQKGLVDKIPEVATGDTTRQAIVNRKAAIAGTLDTFHEADATKLWKSLSPEDQKLFDKIEVGATKLSSKALDDRMVRIAKANAKDPEAFIKYARIHAQDLQTVLEHRQALHPETQELAGYRPHYYDRGDKATNDFLTARENQHALAIKNGKPGYTQHRVIPTYAEAGKILDEKGQPLLKRANANAHEDYVQALHQTANENGQAALIKGLKEAHGSSSVFHVGVSPTGDNLGNLKIPGGKGLSLPDALAEHYNRRAPVTEPINPNLADKAYQGYRRLNQAGKNTIFAGGAFHGTQSALTIGGQQLLSTIRHPSQLGDNLRLIADTFSTKAREAHLQTMAENGADHADGLSSIERQRIANLTYAGKDVQGDLAGKGKGLLNRLPGVKQLHSLVFDRQLPAAKQMIFEQKTAGLDFNKPADLLKARRVATGLNNMIGGIDSAVDGLPPKWAKIIDNVALARDYQQGRFTTVANAVSKWGKNHPEGTLARQAVVGKSIVTALPGMIALVAAGKLDPTDLGAVGRAYASQIISPQIPTSWRGAPTKTNPDGAPITLKLPSTYVTDIAKLLSPIIDPNSTYSGDRFGGIKDFASSRLAFVPAAVEKLSTNKDYFGNPIITNSPVETTKNIAEQFAPIPVAQGAKTAGGEQNLAESVINEAGLRASSSTLPEDTTHSTRLNEFYNTKNSIQTDRGKVVDQMNLLVRNGQVKQADRLAQQFNSTLDSRTKPFRTKYASGYNPAFDTEFLKLKISPTNQANIAREKAIKESDAVLH